MVHNVAYVPPEITNLDIFVSTPPGHECELLIREFQSIGARVQHCWPMPEALPHNVDVLYCDLIAELPDRLPGLPGAPKVAVVVLIPVEPLLDLLLLKNCAADAVLHSPVTRHAILVSLLQARSHFAYQERLRWRISRLNDILHSSAR